MATYYVLPSTGSDAAAGTAIGTAWKTLQKAADTAVAGDIVYLCAEATETTASQIDFDTNVGTSSNFIRFIAADASGNPLTSGYYTVQASAAMTAVLSFATGTGYVRFHRVKIDGNSNATNCVNHANDLNGVRFVDCEMTGATGAGCNVRGASGLYVERHEFSRCNIYSNTGYGITRATGNRGTVRIVGCNIYSNSGGGIYHDRATDIYNNVIRGNTGYGILLGSSADGAEIRNNTIHGNTSDGIRFESASLNSFVFDNAITSNGGYGIYETGGPSAVLNYFWHNLINGNTSGAYANSGGDSSMSTDHVRNINNITSSPGYTNAGSNDFSPASGSALLNAGLSGQSIGAIHPNPAAASAVIVIED